MTSVLRAPQHCNRAKFSYALFMYTQIRAEPAIPAMCSPVWLIGDSRPDNWPEIVIPLDPRHPTRHSIWTPILDRIQRRLFIDRHMRVDDQKFFVRNAVVRAKEKPKASSPHWDEILRDSVAELASWIEEYKPKIVVSFGQFAYEFARRSHIATRERGADVDLRPAAWWTVERLAEAFHQATELPPDGRIAETGRLVPLLHATIARRYFLDNHRKFTKNDLKNSGNYFQYTGDRLANLVFCLKHEPIWLDQRRSV